MRIGYIEICREKIEDYEQIISVTDDNMVFKIETIFREKYNMRRKVSFIDRYEARAIAKYLEKKGDVNARYQKAQKNKPSH